MHCVDGNELGFLFVGFYTLRGCDFGIDVIQSGNYFGGDGRSGVILCIT